MKARSAILGASAALVIAVGCGGGGGGSTPAPAISFSPNRLTATYAQGSTPSQIKVDATVSNLPAAPAYYVKVLAQTQVLNSVSALSSDGPDTYATWVEPWCALAPGSHSGSLQVTITSDAAGQNVLVGGTLPYDFTVTTGNVLTATVDGVVQPKPGLACFYGTTTVSRGSHALNVTANGNVTWSSSLAESGGIPAVTGVVSTPTTWNGTISCTGGGGMVMIRATPVGGGPEAVYLVTFP